MNLHFRHVRAARLCARGLRAWCARHGIDVRRLGGDGVPVEEIAHLRHDPLVARVVKAAEAEEQAHA